MAANRRPSVFLFSCRVAYLGSAATKIVGRGGDEGVSDRDSAFGALQEPLSALYDGDAGVGVARAPRGAFVTVFSTGLQLEVSSSSDQTSRVFFWFSVDSLLLAAAVKRTTTTAATAKAKSGSWRRPRGLRRRLDDASAFAAVDAPETAASRHPALLALLVAGCDEDVMTMAKATSVATKQRGLTRRRRNARSPPAPAPQCHGLVMASDTQARLLEAACRFALAHRYVLADEVHILWQEAVSGLASIGAAASSSSASSSPLVGAAGPSTRGGERSDALASEASDASLSDSSSGGGGGHPGCGDGVVTRPQHPTHWSLAEEYIPSVRIRGNHFDAATFDGYRNVDADRRPLHGWSREYGGVGMADRHSPSDFRRNDHRQERPPEADGWHSGSRRTDVRSARLTWRAEATVAKSAAASAVWRHSHYSAYIDDDEDDGFRFSSDVRRRRARSEAGDSVRHQHRHQHRAPSIESPRRSAEAEAAGESEAPFVNAAANGVAMSFVTGGGIPRVAKARQSAFGVDGGYERRHNRLLGGDGVASSRPMSGAGRRSTLAAPVQPASAQVLTARRRPGTPPADYCDERPAEHRPPPPAEHGSLRRTALDVRSSSYGFGYAESDAASERVAAMSNDSQRRPREPPPAPPLLPPPSIRRTATKSAIGGTPPPPPPPPPPPSAGVPDRERELTDQRNELMRSIRERVRERASVARPQATE